MQSLLPIYLFFEKITAAEAKANHGALNTRYYRCYHGNKRILAITAKMKYCTSGKFYSMRGFIVTDLMDRTFGTSPSALSSNARPS